MHVTTALATLALTISTSTSSDEPAVQRYESDACTSIMVSRGATADGSTMITYSADAPFMPRLLLVPGGKHEDGAMVDAVTQALGPIGILVHNAGVASRGRSVEDTEPGELLRVMSTHALAGHYLSKLVIPGMRDLPRGDIIMISSTATKGLGANGAPYNMAKAAQEALAVTLSKEEKVNGIRVNTVAPGLVETEMGRRLMRANHPHRRHPRQCPEAQRLYSRCRLLPRQQFHHRCHKPYRSRRF